MPGAPISGDVQLRATGMMDAENFPTNLYSQPFFLIQYRRSHAFSDDIKTGTTD
jgi:hypothetical protein